MNWQEEYKRKLTTYEEAAKVVRSGDIVGTALGTGSCSGEMWDAILNRHEELENVRITDSIQVYPSKLYDPKFMAQLEGRVTHTPIFGIITIRKMYQAQLSDFWPATTMDAASKYGERVNVFALMVSKPNKQGYVNLGPTCFYTAECIRLGRKNGQLRAVIAEVNDHMPVVLGDNWMHISEFDYIIERSAPIPTFKRGQPTEVEQRIGEYVLELINDGDTIQMGLGGISEAVAAGLKGKRDLGILTEMLPPALPQLVEAGIVNNSRKPLFKGISIASFVLGDQALYDFYHREPELSALPGVLYQ